MSYRKSVLSISLLFFSIVAFSQTTINFRNNTAQPYEVEMVQNGTMFLQPFDWDLLDSVIDPWDAAVSIFTVARSSVAIPNGNTVNIDLLLKAPSDTVTIQLRLVGVSGGTTLEYSSAGSGFTDSWHTDGNFHQQQTTLAGDDVIVKYQPENNDNNMDRDILYTLHQTPIYSVDAADYQNPNVLNVMTYNIQFLPLGIAGMAQPNDRAALMPAQLSEYQDVIILEEVFDEPPREDHLIPALIAAGFTHITEELNATASPLSIPSNGGVMIASRWPVEFEDDFDFSLCGQAAQDCLASKGIKYARINKLGKKYHVFGTHMDAGSGTDDIEAKNSQMGEMRDFIAAQNIPTNEGVVFGGDFNVSPTDGNRLYLNFHDSISPVIPDPIGFHNSTLRTDTGDIIDHVWGSSAHLIPIEATNEVLTFRPIADDLFELGEFSDHRPAQGRFVYPDIAMEDNKAVHCPGDDMILSINTTLNATYQWQKDGLDLAGETNSDLTITNVTELDEGTYQCVVTYQQEYGNPGALLYPFFFPNGNNTITANSAFSFGFREVDSVLCLVGLNEPDRNISLSIFPNPATNKVTLNWDAIDTRDMTISLSNNLGQVVYYTEQVNGNIHDIDLTELSAGMYFVTLQSGNQMITKKFVLTD